MENTPIYKFINQAVISLLPEYELVKKNKPKVKSRFTWIFDAGHGGINPVNGKYQTKGKGFTFADGFKVQEGVLNRKVLAKVLELAKLLPFELQYETTAHEWRDTSLNERTNKANLICKNIGTTSCRFISIHHNGYEPLPSANGVSVFYQKKNNWYSKGGLELANIINKHQSREMPQFRNRGVKSKNLHVTRKTKCIAALVEGGFMTNREDADEMTSDYGIECYAKSIIETVKEVEKAL